MFTHQSPAKASSSLLPSESHTYTPSPRVRMRVPFFASAALSLKGCRWCAASRRCRVAVSKWSMSALGVDELDVEEEELAFPGADHAQEGLVLAPLHRDVGLAEALAEHLLQPCAVLQRVQRLLQRAWQRVAQVLGAAGQRLGRRELFLDAKQAAAKRRRHRQVWIGVGAGEAAFHARVLDRVQ